MAIKIVSKNCRKNSIEAEDRNTYVSQFIDKNIKITPDSEPLKGNLKPTQGDKQ